MTDHGEFRERFYWGFDVDGTLYLHDFVVRHNEHDGVRVDRINNEEAWQDIGWKRVVKNTAVRSVSSEGVD